MKKWKINPLDEEAYKAETNNLSNLVFEKFAEKEEEVNKEKEHLAFLKGVSSASELNSSYLKNAIEKISEKIDSIQSSLDNASKNINLHGLEVARKFWVQFFPKLDEIFTKYRIQDLINESADSFQQKLVLKINPYKEKVIKGWLQDSNLDSKIIVKIDNNLPENDLSLDWENGGIDYVSNRLFDLILKELEEESNKEKGE